MKNYIIFVVLLGLGAGASSKKVHLRDIKDGPCVSPAPQPIALSIDWAVQFMVDGKYAPMGSSLYYYVTGQRLRGGVPLEDIEEVQGLCLEIISSPFSSVVKGFGKEFTYKCDPTGIGSLTCHAETDKKNTTIDVVVTWTNYQDVLVTLGCLPSGHKFWNVVSTKKTVDERTKASILSHIQAYEFDPKKTIELSYEKC